MSPPLRIGRYALHDEIASGGMAAVHFGQLVGEEGFAKIVAIKRVHRPFAGEPSFRKMILEEARLAARIRHPNVVPPLDVLAEKGELLLVMEYVHGEPLSRLLRLSRNNSECVPLAIAAAIISGVLHGLHAAHEARSETGERLGIIHRDVSPQNILVGADGVARVIDFGIAKAITSTDETLAGTVKGKVPYLAPEQIQGTGTTQRVDVYAASVIFWEMLAGQRLYHGPDDRDLLRRIVNERVQPPGADLSIDAIVLAGLAKTPDDRFATARDMALAIESATPLATPTQIATWVDRLAHAQLAARIAMVAEIEGARAEPVGFQSQTVVMKPVLQPRLAVPTTARLPQPPVSSASNPQLLAPVAGTWMPPVPSRNRRVVWFILALAFVLLLALGGLWFVAPLLVARRIVTTAADRGIVLTIDRVQLWRRAIRLVGVTVSSREVPEVKGHASAVLIELRGLTPETIVIEGGALAIDGTAKDVAYSIGAWHAAHGAAVSQTLASCKHVAMSGASAQWNGIAGPDNTVRFDDASFDLSVPAPRTFGQDWHAAAKVGVKTSGMDVGPWHAQFDRAAPATRATLHFDSTAQNRANASVFSSGEGSPVGTLHVPLTRIADLHLPAMLFGKNATNDTKLGASGEVTFERAGGVGKVSLTVTGLDVGDQLFDMASDLPINGVAPLDAPLVVSSGGKPVGQGKASGEVAGGRFTLTGRVPCGSKTSAMGFSYEAIVVLSALPFGDSRISLEPAPCR